MAQNTIFSIQSSSEFQQKALEIFQFQVEKCTVYRDFIHYLNIDIRTVNSIENIP